MKKLLLVLSLLPIGMSLKSQNEEPMKLPEFSHSIGFDAGGSNGYGFSYRYWPSKWGVQINTFPYLTPKEYDVSIGVSILHTLYESQKLRFYLYYGNHLLFEKYESFDYSYYDGTSDWNTTYTKEETWITGFGPGFEFFWISRLGFNVRFGLGYYYHNADDWAIQPDGGIGLCFRF